MSEPDSFAADWAAAVKAAEAAEAGAPAPKAAEATEAGAEAKPEPTEAKPTEEPAKPEAEATADDEEDDAPEDPEARNIHKRQRLEAIAKELGLTIEGDRVTIEDRVKFREEQRARQKALRARSEELDARAAKLEAEDKAKGEKYHRLAKAIEDADLDAIADIAGAKSWDELNRQFLIQRSSPHAKEMAAVKKQLAEEQAARAKEKAEQEARATAARIEAERKQYFAELSDDVDDAEDESIRAMAKVDGFKELVLRQEQEAYDPERNVTITRAEAMRRALDVAKRQYDALHAAFGGKTAAPDPAKTKRGQRATTSQDTGPKTKGLADYDTTTPEGEKAWRQAWEAQFRAARE